MMEQDALPVGQPRFIDNQVGSRIPVSIPVLDAGMRCRYSIPVFELSAPTVSPNVRSMPAPTCPCSKGSGRRKRCGFLLRTFSGQHHAHSLKQDHQVEEQGVVLDIVQIVLELLG